jgi:mycothiol synthase
VSVAEVEAVVRPMDDRDHPGLLELARACYRDGAEDCREVVHAKAPRASRRYVVEHRDRVIAYAGLRYSPWMAFVRTHHLDLLVHPEHRRRGLGSHLLDRLLRDARDLEQRSVQLPLSEREELRLDFFRKRAFQQTQHSWTMLLDVGAFRRDPLLKPPPGEITITTLAAEQRLEQHHARKVHELWVTVAQDQPGYDSSLDPPFEPFAEWLAGRRTPDGWFIAKAGRQYVGLCGVDWWPQTPDVLYQNVTGTLREWRRRGIATALKLRSIEYAQARGIRTISGKNDTGNPAMLTLNDKLGFRRTEGVITLMRRLD